MSELAVFALLVTGYFAAVNTMYMAVASRTLFTLIGVDFYIAGLSNADYVLWGIVWIGASILVFTRTQTGQPAEHKPDRAHSPALRVVMGCRRWSF